MATSGTPLYTCKCICNKLFLVVITHDNGILLKKKNPQRLMRISYKNKHSCILEYLLIYLNFSSLTHYLLYLISIILLYDLGFTLIVDRKIVTYHPHFKM